MPRRLAIFAVFCWLVLTFLPSTVAPGQNFGGKAIIGPTKGFKVAEPYGPPDEAQTKSLLEGGKAQPMPGGKYLLSEGVTLRSFTTTNTLEMIVKVQECFYNSTQRTVNSAGPIHMETADGKFAIEGTGFFWQQTNSSLIISNKVHTIIQGALLQAGPDNEIGGGQEGGPLLIDSGQFSYDGPSSEGVWVDQVHVTGTNLVLDSAILTAGIPREGRQLRSLLAETNVSVRYGDLLAKGRRLFYLPDTGLIRMTDQATWQAKDREGRGDELIIDRTNHIFQVNHHAWLRLPGQTLGESGFLSWSNAQPASAIHAVNRAIEISCDRYEVRTNWAVFQDQVILKELLDNTSRGKMTCQYMTATFPGTNELQTITAEKNVIIEEGTNRFTGGRAFYTHTNAILEITEHPTWHAGAREGKGDRLRLNTQQNEMLVSGNASMRLPANQLAGQLLPGTSGVTTNRPPKEAGTNQFADIFCQSYLLRPTNSVFEGGVYATHPEMNWSCEKLMVQMATAGMTNVLAQQNVVFDVISQKGPIHGTGDDAVYSFGQFNTGTNGNLLIDTLRLTGTPATMSGTNWTNQNTVILWDRNRNKVTLPGSEYKLQGVGKAIDTNIFKLPKTYRTK